MTNSATIEMQQELARLQAQNSELLTQNAKLEQRAASLQERLRLLEAILYGRKSEKRSKSDDSAQQLCLFDEPQETAPQTPEATAETAEAQTEPDSVRVAEHKRAKPGRRPLPDDLPRKRIEHDLPDDEKTCKHCHCELPRIGEEVTERLDIVPAQVRVDQHVRFKYGPCRCDAGEIEKCPVRLAPMPPQIIPQGIASAGMLAHVVVAKYVDAVPLYRQEQQFLRLGVDIGRGTLSSWVLQVAQMCSILVAFLMDEIRAGPVINADETPVQVLQEPGRANTTKSYMWVFRGGDPQAPAIVFKYAPTRSGSIAKAALANFQGYLQTDGYIGYEAIGEQPGICHVGCMTHARRKFVDVTKATTETKRAGVADHVIAQIRELYRIEDEIRGCSADQIKVSRQEKSRPILEKLKVYLEEKRGTTPPKSLLGKAIGYSLNQWPRLLACLEDGRISIDNNAAENAIRPFAVGRKNWLFCGSPAGAEAGANLYSLIETAKANGIEPYAYLRFLFARLPMATTEAALRALLPQHLDRKQLALT